MADQPGPRRSPYIDRLIAEAVSGTAPPETDTDEVIRRLEAADVEGALALLWGGKR